MKHNADNADIARAAVRYHLRWGIGLMSAKPKVLEQDPESIVQHLAIQRIEICTIDRRELLARFGVPLHLRAFSLIALQVFEWSALRDPVSWRACEILATAFIEADAPLPAPLKSFTLKALRGEIIKPTPPRGPNRYKNYWRYQEIADAVFVAMDAGLNAFRNAESETISACDVVAECLRDYRIKLTYDGVKKIYDKLNKSPAPTVR